MTKPLDSNPFKIPGLDNFSLRQSNNVGEELTRDDFAGRMEVQFEHLEARFDRILILLEDILNEMQKKA